MLNLPIICYLVLCCDADHVTEDYLNNISDTVFDSIPTGVDGNIDPFEANRAPIFQNEFPPPLKSQAISSSSISRNAQLSS